MNTRYPKHTSPTRAQRIEEMKRRKKRQLMIRKYCKIIVPVLTVILAILAISIFKNGDGNEALPSAAIPGKEIASLPQGSVLPVNTPTPKPTQEPVSTPTPKPTQEPASTTTPKPTQEPVSTPTPKPTQEPASTPTPKPTQEPVFKNPNTIYTASMTENTLQLHDEIVSKNAVFIDLNNGIVLAQKDMSQVISPASMTKILTILVAAEHIQPSQLDDLFTMTLEITDYGYINDCSSAGFLGGEQITVRDLFYGTILPSGADAALGLAVYTAGSHETFVDMMNEKLEELGLSDTAHVTNCVGLYDTDHHCSVYDMAMIMEAAVANDFCREVMTAHTYTTTATSQHPEGILLSNWFLRRIEDKDTGGEVICAKTGYVNQSGNCAASFGKDHAGNEYICVTADASSAWKCIYDHVALYKKYAAGE